MNQISKHIAYLILTCREVSVPGLGTFSASYERASFDADDGIFYPSKIRIKFSNEQRDENSLLEYSLERRLNIREREAMNLIKNYVEKVQSKISMHKYCRLDGIGYLMQDSYGNISLKDTFWKKQNYPSFTSIRLG